MRIGMIAPISHPFPPDGYGPWERVCHDLTEGLVELGHEVLVYAPEGSTTSAELRPTVPAPVSDALPHSSPDPRLWEESPTPFVRGSTWSTLTSMSTLSAMRLSCLYLSCPPSMAQLGTGPTT